MPVPGMAAMFDSDIVCKIFAASKIPPVTREIAASMIKTVRIRRGRTGKGLQADCVGRGIAGFSADVSTPSSVRVVAGCS